MKYSLGISKFLEEISGLSCSIVFLYFFPLITEEGFLISPRYSLKLCIQMLIFPFLLCFSLLFFSQLICKASPDSHFAFLHFFSMGMVLIPVSCTMSWTSVHSSSDWFQIGKGVRRGCILSPCLFNFYAEHIMKNAVLEEAQAGIKIARRNINNLRYADDTTLMAEREEEQ